MHDHDLRETGPPLRLLPPRYHFRFRYRHRLDDEVPGEDAPGCDSIYQVADCCDVSLRLLFKTLKMEYGKVGP